MLTDELLFEGGHVLHISLYYRLRREERRVELIRRALRRGR